MRSASFVSGGVLPASRRGQNESRLVHITDWYSTFCHLAGVDPSDSHPGVPDIDAVNQWPVISGESTEPARTEVFTVENMLIQNDWKILQGEKDLGDARWSGPLYPKVPATGDKVQDCSQGCLYNISADAGEHHDLSKEYPAVTKQMLGRLAQLQQTIWKPTYPNVTQEEVCDTSARYGHGFVTPADYKPSGL